MRTYHIMLLLGSLLTVISLWLVFSVNIGLALLLTLSGILTVYGGVIERRLSLS